MAEPRKTATKRTTTAAKKAPAQAPAKAARPRKPAALAVPEPPPETPEPEPVPVVDTRPNAIEVTGLRRSFKGGVDAVRGVDLTVREGEVFGFLGPNGAGKTTTVRMLCTLLPLSGGAARVAGHDVVREPAAVRRRIGVALQEIGLDPLQTARELLELQCGLYGMDPARSRTRAAELLELVGLTEAANRRTKTFSGGMKRRLDLASALVHSPSVLFLDEPTTGLDPASRATVWEEVRRINDSGTTVFLTTQYLEEADQLCDRLAIIDHGEIVAAGTPEELKSSMGHDVVTLTLPPAGHEAARAAVDGLPGLQQVVAERDALALYVDNGAECIPELVRLLDKAGVTARAISVARPTLDDVFLKATGRRLEGDEEGSDA
ncbi:MAG TPA: ATP-binding cassette domain-containing protein [Mycobacteriales bacterium]|nr:ATP-binding cassette domain-containing protein [Mycobacteriales bacterium]